MTLNTALPGLSAEEVAQRQRLGQTNEVKQYTSRNLGVILRANLLTLFNAVVGTAFILLLVLGQWQDALFGIAVLFNITIGIVQEIRSKIALDKLSLIGQKLVLVRRSGSSQLIPKEQLVLDDLLELRPGDQLVVDATVVSSTNLEVDESLLTGEADPVAKQASGTLLSGSIVLAGSALATVSKVGDYTYASQLSKAAKRFTRVSSEIQDSLNRVVKWISWVLLPLILIVLFGQLHDSADLVASLTKAVASVISMVPQGLVLISSITFAISAIRLVKAKVLLQELASVEGLARVNLICFDKTGTLTTGRFEFSEAILVTNEVAANWKAVLGAFVHQASANATALALRKDFPASGLEITETTEFTSTSKFGSITINSQQWKLGAPEVLTTQADTLARTQELSSLGFRVLLLGIQEVHFSPQVLIVLKEEINPKAAATLNYFKAQGVQIKILSGDHPRTVSAVARAAGLEYSGFGCDARDFDNNDTLLLDQESIFGRVTPAQKQEIVARLQEKARVVAMVGDGVNDVLALKQADLGIAMGSGSAASRATADLVLIDDDFSKLPKVVSEGRRVIANVERLTTLFLTKTVWAMALAIVFGLALWEFPYLPRQIAAIDAFTIGIPAFLIALLPNQKLYRKGFLKRTLIFCIPAGLLTALAVCSLKIVRISSESWSTQETQSATLVILSLSGLSILSVASRPWTRVKVSIFLAMCSLGTLIFCLPFSSEFFQFVFLNQDQLLITLAIGLIQIVLLELCFRIIRARHQN